MNHYERIKKYHKNSRATDGKDKEEIVDFKVDVMTCKATVHNISEVLHNCINLISLQEDSFVKCIEQETEKRQQMEEMYRTHVTCKNSTPAVETEVSTDIYLHRRVFLPTCTVLIIGVP